MSHTRDHIIIQNLIADPRTTSSERATLTAISDKLEAGGTVSSLQAIQVALITRSVLRREAAE